VAESKPKAKSELAYRAAIAYADLPKATTKYNADQDTPAAGKQTAKADKGKNRKEIQVASTAPRSLKESPRASSKEVARRSEKLEAPVTASMLPGFGSAKKAKKETPSIARKPTGTATANSKSKKKKKDDS
jgi:hypothetical protein